MTSCLYGVCNGLNVGPLFALAVIVLPIVLCLVAGLLWLLGSLHSTGSIRTCGLCERTESNMTGEVHVCMESATVVECGLCLFMATIVLPVVLWLVVQLLWLLRRLRSNMHILRAQRAALTFVKWLPMGLCLPLATIALASSCCW